MSGNQKQFDNETIVNKPSLAKLSKWHYVEVKPEVRAPKMLVFKSRGRNTTRY